MATETRTPLLKPKPITHKDHPARRAAKAYYAKCPWASFDDLLQEAFVATTLAARTFDPAKGRNIDAYMFRAAVYGLKRYMHHEFSAVSIKFRHHAEQLKTNLSQGRGGYVLPWNRELPIALDHDEIDPAIMVVREGWADRVRARLAELLTDDAHTERAIPVLMGYEDSSTTARKHGVEVTEIYYATLRARRRIAKDPTLRDLWRDHDPTHVR